MRYLISVGSALLCVVVLSSPAFAIAFSVPQTSSNAGVAFGCVDANSQTSSGASSALASCQDFIGGAIVNGRGTADSNINLLRATARAFVDPLFPATVSDSQQNAVGSSLFDDFVSVSSSAFFFEATARLDAVILSSGNVFRGDASAMEFVNLVGQPEPLGSGGDKTCNFNLLASGSGECTVRIGVKPGERVALEMTMRVEANVRFFGSAQVDASQTGTITNLQFLDQNSNPLPGVITGESGTVYPSGGAPAPVPEPSTLILLVSGVAGLAGLTRRRRRR